MTQVIDGKVVEMKFDNADFEKNVAQSMSTLDKLKQALNFDSAKSLQEVGKASKNFSMDGVANAVDAVQAKFSMLQVVGYTALQELTKAAMHLGSKMVNAVVGPITQGGLNRALNIEQAKFQLEGLGVAWDDIVDDINYGVKDTAYGLDSAAKAAAQLTASGVQMGDEMKASLRGISGVAAMTNSTYDEISPIFTTVAGQGRVMTMQLRQLESRGLNAAATLAKYLDSTEAEVREMVTKGKIDFQTFANAMDDAFGQHAKDANKTFTGAMSNVKAALARIGAKVATPGLENVRVMLVDLIGLIDKFSATMDGPIQFINDSFKTLTTNIHYVLSDVSKFEQVYKNISEGIGQALYDILLVITPIKNAFRDVFPKSSVNNLISVTAKIKDFLATLRISSETGRNVQRTFRGIFSIFGIFINVIKAVIEALFPATKELGSFGDKVLNVTGNIGDFIYAIFRLTNETNFLQVAIGKLKDFVLPIFTNIGDAVKRVIDLFKQLAGKKLDLPDGSTFGDLAKNLSGGATPIKVAADIFKTAFGIVISVIKEASPLLGAFGQLIGTAAGQIANGFEQIFSGGGFKTLLSLVNSAFLVTIGLDIAAFIHHIIGSLSKSLKIIDGIKGLISNVSIYFKALGMSVKADALKKIAISIGILAASLWVLSTIPADKLAGTLAVVTILMGELAGMLVVFSKVADDFKGAVSVFASGAGFAAMSTGILLLAAALKVISSIDSDSLIDALGAITELIIELTGVSLVLSKYGGTMQTGSLAIVAFSVGITILASALKKIASIEPERMTQAMQGITLAIIELTGAMLAMGKSEFGAGQALGVVAISVALNVLAGALEKIGTLQPEQLAQGLLTIAAALASLAVFMDVLGDNKNMMTIGASVFVLSVAINVLATAMNKIGSMPMDQWSAGLIGMVAAMFSMVAVFKALESMDVGKMLGISGAMLVLSVAIGAVSLALGLIGSMPIANIITGLTGIIVTLITFAAAGAIFGAAAPLLLKGALVIAALGAASLVAAAGMAASSIAIGLLASALEELANLGAGKFFAAIGMLVASFAALAVGSVALLPVVAVLLPLAASLMGIAVAANIFAASISLAAVGLALMATSFKMFETIDPFAIVKGLGALLVALLAFGVLGTVLAPASVSILALGAGFALLGVGTVTIAAGILLLTAAFERLAPIVVQAAEAFTRFMAEIGPKIVSALKTAWNIFVSFGTNLISYMLQLGANILKSVVNAASNVLTVLTKLGGEMLKALGVPADWVDAGVNFITGLIKGIKEKINSAVDAVADVGKGMLKKIKSVLKINSPSKEAEDVGEWFDKGLGNGVTNLKDFVQGKVADVGSGMIGQASSDASEVENIWDSVGQLSGTRKANKASDAVNDLRKEMINSKNPANEYNNSLKETAKNEEEVAKATGKASGKTKEQKDIFDKIKDSITNSMDIFNKFETKTELTGAKLLENMKSNIDGVANWTSKLNSLIDKGISKELYNKLAEMGPKSYEIVNAMTQLTGEQLAQANDYFATSLTMGDDQTNIIKDSYDRVGVNVAQGAINGLESKTGEMNKTANEAGVEMTDALADGAGCHSPSVITFATGQYVMEGLQNGLRSGLGFTRITAASMAQIVVNTFTNGLRPSIFYEIGKNATYGLGNGLADSKAAESVFQKAREIAERVSSIMRHALDEHSPSKVTRKIGEFASLGLALGLEDAASRVYRAADSVAEGTIEALTDNGRIQDLIDTSLDLNPVITPMLDLSVMKEQLNSIGDMFASRELALSGQNGGKFTANADQPTSINFTQNNYSPKELSRYDIYRQTKNQISMMKGVIAHA